LTASRRVAVIGAGPSGLATIKELLAEGHGPVGFERAAGLGGVFRYDDAGGVIWESCRLTSSALLTSFSDFPPPPGGDEQLTARAYVDYLRAYATAFDLERRIRFSHSVESVARRAGGGWTVRSVDAAGERREEEFDAVAVASGLHQHPDLPRYPGQATFPGAILHGSRFRGAESARGLRVVVVGAGESGADIAAEIAAVAAETVLSLRRGVSVLPRRQFGYPNDYQTCRLTNSAAPWIAATRDPADRGKRRLFATICFPFFLLDRLLQDATRLGWEVLPLFSPRHALAGRGGLERLRLALATRRESARLLAESQGTFGEQFGTKSDEFVRAIAAGRCRRAGAIERFEGRRVVFAGGESIEADLVILATGFVGRVPFLDAALAARPRYLRTFVPEVGAGLAFVGFLRPALGAIPPLAELQARWFARLLSGAAELPSPSEMQAEIEGAREFRRRHFRAHRERLEELVDFTSVCDALARQIGCLPTRQALAGESRRFRRRFFAGPFVAAQYRLRGPHARPELARRTIESLPLALPPPRFVGNTLRWAWSRLFGRLFGPGWAPKLELPEA